MVNSQNNTQGQPKQMLAIMVSTDKHMDHVVKLTTAAVAKGKRVGLFICGKGVLLTKRPQFKQLADMASVSICEASFRANGLHGRQAKVSEGTAIDFTGQAKHAEMLAQADRYLVF